MTDLTIRSATAADTAALARLAALDSSVVPAGPIFVAEHDERLIAAVSARDGAAIADPLTRSADAGDILRRRAHQVAARRTRAPRPAAPRPAPRAADRPRRRPPPPPRRGVGMPCFPPPGPPGRASSAQT